MKKGVGDVVLVVVRGYWWIECVVGEIVGGVTGDMTGADAVGTFGDMLRGSVRRPRLEYTKSAVFLDSWS